METADKAHVIRVLREIAVLLQVKGENAFKSRAYEIAADRLAGSQEDLATLVQQNRLQEIPGIGSALSEKISELVRTGKMAYHDQLKAQYPPGITELMKVPDLGPKKAALLWEQLGIGDVDGLEKACKAQQLRGLKGFGEKSESKILAGIEVYRRAVSEPDRRRLGDVLAIAEEILNQVQKIPFVKRAALGGSVRRFRETVADVDLIASADPAHIQAVMKAFSAHDQVREVLASGDSKTSVRLFKGDLQVDLRVVPDEDFATALHHFTGSKAHHIRLRGLAQDRGLKISEWGVHRGEEKLPVPDERALYELLGMQYVPPELREDWGEVEAALQRQLPEDLISMGDIAGNVHSHSTWSDGRNSLEEMANTARAMGLRYYTVTEHSQSAGYAGGLTYDRLQRQWAEIDALNEKLVPHGFRLLKGIESDILEDGRLDYPDSVLEKLEVVIGSIHVRHGLDEEGMTKRVLAAFDNPHLHILGHPTGRLINERAAYGLKMEAVLDRAAERGVAIEVNGSPHRMDIKADYVRMALQRGVRLVASTDAHATSELSFLTYSVGTARKGWARRSDILNTRSADEFVATLRSMRRH
ncbi:MAG TPA: DNA polymerase/3'-5' exonuclease PolX [Myxococcaceae bacterium]